MKKNKLYSQREAMIKTGYTLKQLEDEGDKGLICFQIINGGKNITDYDLKHKCIIRKLPLLPLYFKILINFQSPSQLSQHWVSLYIQELN